MNMNMDMNSENIISVSEKALNQISEIVKRENKGNDVGLRLGVIGGGCSGLSYKMDLGSKQEKDNVLIFDEIKIFIDPKSAIYLKGIHLDYDDGLNGKGFTFENPNAKNTCGCGESFAV